MRLFPRSLFGRLILVLLTGLILAQFISALVLLRDRGQALYRSVQTDVITRTVGIVRLLDSISLPERERLVPLLSSEDMRVTLARTPIMKPQEGAEFETAARLVRSRIVRHLPQHTRVEVSFQRARVPETEPTRHHPHMMGRGMAGPWAYMHGLHAMGDIFHIQVELKDGTWVRFERQVPESLFGWPSRLLITLGILLVSVVALSLLAVRWSVGPLRSLRLAAEALGKDIHREPLAVEGPVEVAETARAFNTMQQRLKNYIEDRARILAAVSHDLKTPLTRLRLRSDLLEDEKLRQKIQTDLGDMESMVGATLDFMRGTETKEPSQPLDLMALLESIQGNMSEAGWVVELTGRIDKPIQGKPLALKRCITNLVDNAVHYGERADVTVDDQDQQVVISVSDNGPGIPEDSLERVFDPFFRLEASRSQHTGGTGLGLGIARNIARAHGGELVLENRPRGGLTARLLLPR
jgi:signal transduction histidine kinase